MWAGNESTTTFMCHRTLRHLEFEEAWDIFDHGPTTTSPHLSGSICTGELEFISRAHYKSQWSLKHQPAIAGVLPLLMIYLLYQGDMCSASSRWTQGSHCVSWLAWTVMQQGLDDKTSDTEWGLSTSQIFDKSSSGARCWCLDHLRQHII